MLYFPSVAFMARNAEMQIAILRYFANMYQNRQALLYHRQDNDFNVFRSTDLHISKDLDPYYRPVICHSFIRFIMVIYSKLLTSNVSPKNKSLLTNLLVKYKQKQNKIKANIKLTGYLSCTLYFEYCRLMHEALFWNSFKADCDHHSLTMSPFLSNFLPEIRNQYKIKYF